MASGIQVAPLLLHTGVASLEDHEPPYEEFYRVRRRRPTASTPRSAGHRVVAVGATVVRALETVTDIRDGSPQARMDQSRDWSRTTAALGERHDHWLPRTAGNAPAMVEQVIVAAGGRSLFHLLRAYREAQEAGYCGTSSVTHT